ncbi:MAG: L-2-amino-thiazoline-4-carboxylic acid hydrolase [Candidatus Atribacteria bacterium]|nr:L-2-amino-thiazoline-4-carboxylic acid hydrolase [Candidatus Atribacteria bacterium]
MSKEEKKQMVDLEEAEEQVRKVCKRLALLYLSYTKTIINELGDKEGTKLVLKAIKDYGVRIGEEIKENVFASGINNDVKNYKEDLPLYGMHDGAEKVEVNGEKRIKAFGCVMGKLWKELGEDKIGRLYCYVDPAKYMAYNPDFKLVHLKSIPDGDKCCEFTVKSTTEQERKDFLEKDKDWSYIDK